ncbi:MULTISPECIES: hypothetical protein [unclassified Enterobacter]|uniref:hypothetical protein n=1 Tax=unclassified Enterobacter TaxID=2608935 RepID=UPI0011CE0D90|nr:MULTISPECIES: hypothetical protein [unclassified Enterobacter]
MAQGLQCWDANGVMVVDIGDYNMRYMGTRTLNVTPNITSWNIAFPGMRVNGWLAVQRLTITSNNIFYCIPGNESFAVQYLPTTGTYPQTITFDIYKYGE